MDIPLSEKTIAIAGAGLVTLGITIEAAATVKAFATGENTKGTLNTILLAGTIATLGNQYKHLFKLIKED